MCISRTGNLYIHFTYGVWILEGGGEAEDGGEKPLEKNGEEREEGVGFGRLGEGSIELRGGVGEFGEEEFGGWDLVLFGEVPRKPSEACFFRFTWNINLRSSEYPAADV